MSRASPLQTVSHNVTPGTATDSGVCNAADGAGDVKEFGFFEVDSEDLQHTAGEAAQVQLKHTIQTAVQAHTAAGQQESGGFSSPTRDNRHQMEWMSPTQSWSIADGKLASSQPGLEMELLGRSRTAAVSFKGACQVQQPPDPLAPTMHWYWPCV